MADQKIVATHPDDENLYVLSTDAPKNGNPDIPYGRVLDLNDKILYPALPLVSLSARDPWQKYTGDQAKLKDLLEGVKDIQIEN